MKTRYRFTHQAGGAYYWESVLPVALGDSRHERISCRADWFWGKGPR